MSRLKQTYASEGFFGIGIYHPEIEENIGTLWRTAYILGASFIFIIGKRFKKESSDVTHSWSKIPLYIHDDFSSFLKSFPYSTQLIGIEMHEHSTALHQYVHPTRAVYLLGSESAGLPENILNQCHALISLPGNFSLNVATAGSIVIYDRIGKIPSPLPLRTLL